MRDEKGDSYPALTNHIGVPINSMGRPRPMDFSVAAI